MPFRLIEAFDKYIVLKVNNKLVVLHFNRMATLEFPLSLPEMATYVYDRLDPRTKDWPLIGNPLFPLVVCGGYLWFVYGLGPKLMKTRDALDLRWAIRLHNLFMVVSNAYFFCAFLSNSYLANYNFWCQGMMYATDLNSLRIVSLGWWYLLVRSLDLLDTVFFVLRKKFSHVTFQHVSHHFCCIFFGHIWLSLGMDGQSLFGLSVNSAVHVIMYMYYFLASFGSHMKPYLWWKKYLTVIQIYQHFAVIGHGLIPLFYNCGYPKFFIYLALPQGLLGLVLFLNFYVLTYTEKNRFFDIFSTSVCILSDDNDPTKPYKSKASFGNYKHQQIKSEAEEELLDKTKKMS